MYEYLHHFCQAFIYSTTFIYYVIKQEIFRSCVCHQASCQRRKISLTLHHLQYPTWLHPFFQTHSLLHWNIITSKLPISLHRLSIRLVQNNQVHRKRYHWAGVSRNKYGIWKHPRSGPAMKSYFNIMGRYSFHASNISLSSSTKPCIFKQNSMNSLDCFSFEAEVRRWNTIWIENASYIKTLELPRAQERMLTPVDPVFNFTCSPFCRHMPLS